MGAERRQEASDREAQRKKPRVETALASSGGRPADSPEVPLADPPGVSG
jgi:hypothetical protein